MATRGQSCTIPSRKIPQRTPGVTTTAVEAWTTPEEAGLFPREDTLSTTDTDVMDETVTIVTAAAAELRAREFEQEDSHRDAGTMIASETQASAIAEEQAITFPVAEIVSARVDDRNETGEHAAAAADATAETSSALSTIAVVMPAGSSGGSTMVDETAPPKGDVSGGEAKRLAAPPLPQRRQRSLWERLPRDVSDAVRKAARATELLVSWEGELRYLLAHRELMTASATCRRRKTFMIQSSCYGSDKRRRSRFSSAASSCISYRTPKVSSQKHKSISFHFDPWG